MRPERVLATERAGCATALWVESARSGNFASLVIVTHILIGHIVFGMSIGLTSKRFVAKAKG